MQAVTTAILVRSCIAVLLTVVSLGSLGHVQFGSASVSGDDSAAGKTQAGDHKALRVQLEIVPGIGALSFSEVGTRRLQMDLVLMPGARRLGQAHRDLACIADRAWLGRAGAGLPGSAQRLRDGFLRPFPMSQHRTEARRPVAAQAVKGSLL